MASGVRALVPRVLPVALLASLHKRTSIQVKKHTPIHTQNQSAFPGKRAVQTTSWSARALVALGPADRSDQDRARPIGRRLLACFRLHKYQSMAVGGFNGTYGHRQATKCSTGRAKAIEIPISPAVLQKLSERF
jgi:hypothetical protein